MFYKDFYKEDNQTQKVVRMRGIYIGMARREVARGGGECGKGNICSLAIYIV